MATMAHTVTVQVNSTTIHSPEDELTGLQIKQAAIAAGAKDVEATDLLELVHGHKHVTVRDDQEIELHTGEVFVTHPVGKDS